MPAQRRDGYPIAKTGHGPYGNYFHQPQVEEINCLKDQMSQANKEINSDYECLPVDFYEVTDTDSIEFEEATRIYAESFPENERRPIAAINEMVNGGRGRLMVGKRENEIVLMSLLYPLADKSCLLVDYLATAKEHRSTGLGRAFLRHILDRTDDLQFNSILIEIENPYLDDDDAKLKRLKFYKSLGMKELQGVRYLLPPFQGDEPVELILLIFSRDDADHLAGEAVRSLVIQLFGELYDRFEDDWFLTSTLGSIPDFVPLI